MGSNSQDNQSQNKDDISIAVDSVKSFFGEAYKKTAEITRAAGEAAKNTYDKADKKYHDPKFQ